MNIWSLPLILGLSFAMQLAPNAAEAPTRLSPDESFVPVGSEGFSFRWVSDEAIKAQHLECNSYMWCSFADIIGPSCPHELFVGLDFYDKNELPLMSGGDVLPSSGRRTYRNVELGTNNLDSFVTFDVSEISCYQGLPTGKPNL